MDTQVRPFPPVGKYGKGSAMADLTNKYFFEVFITSSSKLIKIKDIVPCLKLKLLIKALKDLPICTSSTSYSRIAVSPHGRKAKERTVRQYASKSRPFSSCREI